MFRSVTKVLALVVALTAIAATAFCQEATVIAAAPIYLYPDATRTPLRTAAVNTRLRVVEAEQDGWVRVEFQDPQLGRRTGWVELRFLRIARPELEPIDLSVAPPSGQPVEPSAGPARSGPAPVRFRRGFVDVNIGLAAARGSDAPQHYVSALYGEQAEARVDYHWPIGASFDFGGGVMLTPGFGLGLSFAGAAHQDAAGLFLRIPHPRYADAFAEDSSETDADLEHIESAVHVQAVFATDVSPRVRVRLFGGPTLFRVRQDLVETIRYDHAYSLFTTANAVKITGVDLQQVDFDETSGWGGHVGGDISYFFNGVVGLGGFARYSAGSVEYVDPFDGERHEMKTGGLQAGAGLRLRF